MSIATLSTLEQANFTVEQARALTRVLEEDHHNLATKDDINSLRMATKNDIRFLETKLTGEIKSLESKLTGEIKSLESKMAGEIKSLESEMAGEIKSLEAKMVTKTELNKTSNYLIRWIVTGMFFNIGVLYVLLKYFGQA